MKKVIVSAALSAAMFSSVAHAEKSGWFVGVDLGVNSTTQTLEGLSQDEAAKIYDVVDTALDPANTAALGAALAANPNLFESLSVLEKQGQFMLSNKASSAGNFRYGLMAGYKYFFTPKFGVRGYLTLNNGKTYIPEGAKTHKSFNALNIFANADALYNIVDESDYSFGFFAGVSVGYALYNGGVVKQATDFSKDLDPSGIDVGINFGIRTLIKEHHGIEFFTRYGVYHTTAKYTADLSQLNTLARLANAGSVENPNMKAYIHQAYTFGMRYTYNF